MMYIFSIFTEFFYSQYILQIFLFFKYLQNLMKSSELFALYFLCDPGKGNGSIGNIDSIQFKSPIKTFSLFFGFITQSSGWL